MITPVIGRPDALIDAVVQQTQATPAGFYGPWLVIPPRLACFVTYYRYLRFLALISVSFMMVCLDNYFLWTSRKRCLFMHTTVTGCPTCPVCEIFLSIWIRVKGTIRPRFGVHGIVHVSATSTLSLAGFHLFQTDLEAE